MTPWLFVAVIVGTILARALHDLTVWLWRRNHSADDVEDVAGERHREVEGWLADQNDRIDTLAASLAEQGGKHGVTGPTRYMPPAQPLATGGLVQTPPLLEGESGCAYSLPPGTVVVRHAAPVTAEPPAASDTYTGILGWPT